MVEIYADADFVMVQALRGRLPDDVYVASTSDTDTPLRGATVLVRAATGVPFANAKPTAGGEWTVSVMVLDRDTTKAQALAGRTLGLIESLEATMIPEAGYISTVDAVMLPVRSSPTEVANSSKFFTQYNMQFTVRLRPHKK